MQTPFDEFGKDVTVQVLLKSRGETRGGHTTPGEPQEIDVLFIPAEQHREDVPGAFAWLAQEAGVIELFHEGPRLEDVHACFAKQVALHKYRGQGHSWLRDQPRLWLISARTPRTVVSAYALSRRKSAPSGFYDSRTRGLRLSLIAVPELPLGRDTLLLRLLGRDRVLVRALRELRELPKDAVERKLAYPAVERLRDYLPANTRDEEVGMAVRETYEEMVERTTRLGEARGEARALTTLLAARSLPLDDAHRARIEQCTDATLLLRWIERAVRAETADEVFASD